MTCAKICRTRETTTEEGWRTAVFSELDYAYRQARTLLNRRPDACHAWMVRTTDWKYVLWQGYRPQLFNLRDDPDEFFDLGEELAHENIRAAMQTRLLEWFASLRHRTSVTLPEVEQGTNRYKEAGVFYGVW